MISFQISDFRTLGSNSDPKISPEAELHLNSADEKVVEEANSSREEISRIIIKEITY